MMHFAVRLYLQPKGLKNGAKKMLKHGRHEAEQEKRRGLMIFRKGEANPQLGKTSSLDRLKHQRHLHTQRVCLYFSEQILR
ncbi:hypothetical protein T03_8960 [Trichinella britovi]|uniref:Uncharacterized protein n=1 Tax=Trichinella britovi TaxID=45882 RepID=A0A0V1CJ60_TRIBR|nr:hypothetical protein T03_8960 [Trichinella britovi]